MSLRRLPMTWPKQVPTIPPIERLVQRPQSQAGYTYASVICNRPLAKREESIYKADFLDRHWSLTCALGGGSMVMRSRPV
jgi:predicted chitinase